MTETNNIVKLTRQIATILDKSTLDEFDVMQIARNVAAIVICGLVKQNPETQIGSVLDYFCKDLAITTVKVAESFEDAIAKESHS